MKVSINIITWNGRRYIEDCLKSIFSQTFKDFKVLIVDNASDDGTTEFIKANYPEVTILQNFKNLGFCKSNNQAIKFWDSEYILLCNQDVVLATPFLENLVKIADQNPQAGSFGGKTFKISLQEDHNISLKPEIIDSAGIAATKSRRFYDRGAGEQDKGQYSKTESVFGISGNLVLYRRTALAATKIKIARPQKSSQLSQDAEYYEYLDENFFMYKDDVDLAWRLQLAGYPALYVPTAEAYHYRSGFGSARANNFKTIKERRRKSKFVNRLSYRNHWLTLLKNESLSNFFINLPWILGYELKKIGYVLILETATLKMLIKGLKFIPQTLVKRKQVKKMRQINNQAIRQWFK
ncbi:MAG: glycosyltransferase family 2 protein [Patescibacteria group bacterium]